MRNAVEILVVEDSVIVKKRLRLALDCAGFQVDTAQNGREALEKARRKQFDFVVTDEQMPIMTGQELCLRLSADRRYVDTPIIFLTAGRENLDTKELLECLEVSAIFDKPFDPQSIVHFIDARRLVVNG